MTVRETIGDAVSGLPTVDLAMLAAEADLQTRIDRKYIVTPEQAVTVVRERAGELAVLDITGTTAFAYESVYFDTPELDSYFGSAHRRRRRFKVRTRSYLDSGLSLLEVKTRGGRGETVKERTAHLLDRRDDLDDAARGFVRDHDVPAHLVERLRPVLTTRYHRTTLLAADGSRATLDLDLWCGHADRSTGLPKRVLLETKALGGATALDRALWRAGTRPLSVSKFGTGLAAITPGLPANKWNLTLRRHFGWLPAR